MRTATKQKQLFDFAAQIIDERPTAIRLFDGVNTAWFPKAVVEDYGDGTFAVPEFFAREKGFL